jgi:hypothetical protein
MVTLEKNIAAKSLLLLQGGYGGKQEPLEKAKECIPDEGKSQGSEIRPPAMESSLLSFSPLPWLLNCGGGERQISGIQAEVVSQDL